MGIAPFHHKAGTPWKIQTHLLIEMRRSVGKVLENVVVDVYLVAGAGAARFVNFCVGNSRRVVINRWKLYNFFCTYEVFYNYIYLCTRMLYTLWDRLLQYTQDYLPCTDHSERTCDRNSAICISLESSWRELSVDISFLYGLLQVTELHAFNKCIKIVRHQGFWLVLCWYWRVSGRMFRYWYPYRMVPVCCCVVVWGGTSVEFYPLCSCVS